MERSHNEHPSSSLRNAECGVAHDAVRPIEAEALEFAHNIDNAWLPRRASISVIVAVQQASHIFEHNPLYSRTAWVRKQTEYVANEA